MPPFPWGYVLSVGRFEAFYTGKPYLLEERGSPKAFPSVEGAVHGKVPAKQAEEVVLLNLQPSHLPFLYFLHVTIAYHFQMRYTFNRNNLSEEDCPMKRFNRILAALLAALMLCGAWAAVAEMNVELNLDAQANPGSIELEIDPENGANGPDGGLALDDGLQLDGVDLPNSELEIGIEDNLLIDGAEAQGDGPVQSNDSNSDFEIKNGVLVKYTGDGGDVVIPNNVTVIGDDAFYGCEDLTSVTIPKSVEYISNGYDDSFYDLTSSESTVGAFAFCTNLEQVTIANGLTEIGDNSFFECNIHSILIPKSVTYIGEFAFWGNDMSEATILAKQISIDDCAFETNHYTYSSNPTFHIINGSNAIKWAKENHFNYDIIKDGLSEKTLELVSGKTHQLNVYNIGKKVSNVTWNSNDKTVATVNNGKVTAKKVGKCIISATLESGKTLKCNVTVYDPAEISDKTLTLNMGETYKLKVTGLLKRKVTWTSSNTSVATVKNGKITPKKAGKCTITATLSKEKYLAKKTLKCKLTVTDPAALSAEKLTISTIDYARIKLTGALKRKVTWSTSNAKVVKITKSSADYVSIKGLKKGSATITAKIEGGKTLKCAVTVVNPLSIKEDWDDDFDDLASWEVGVKFTNHSNKKIIYVTFDILQYNNRGDKLKSPYDYYYFNNDINPHSSYWDNYQVNDDTRSVKFKITEVTFADKTTWKP